MADPGAIVIAGLVMAAHPLNVGGDQYNCHLRLFNIKGLGRPGSFGKEQCGRTQHFGLMRQTIKHIDDCHAAACHWLIRLARRRLLAQQVFEVVIQCGAHMDCLSDCIAVTGWPYIPQMFGHAQHPLCVLAKMLRGASVNQRAYGAAPQAGRTK